MKNVVIALISSLVISMSAWADVVPVNPTNDPNGQSFVGMGIERLSVQGCGSQKDVSQILPAVQGEDTFDVQHHFLKLNENGVPEWVDLQLTGNYSWLKNTMFLTLDDASRTVLLNLIQFEVGQLCQNDATLIPRSITLVKNEVKVSGNKRVNGVLQLKAKYKATTSFKDGMDIGHGLMFGDVTYTLHIKGGLQ